ncbi:MAG: DNA polymerase IV [Gemmatimonadota bacterium]
MGERAPADGRARTGDRAPTAGVGQAADRTILHVDMDAFFAAVEIRENPSLRGRPVVVGSDPRGGRGRGVVSTASYEARRYGIHSALPISEAYRRCPGAAYLRPRISLYSRISTRIFEILGRYTDRIEPLSLDEAFLDVTASRALFGAGPEIARAIKREIVEAEKLTTSVGVACSKFLAKLASDLEKPDGLVVVPEGREREFLAPLEVARLWGAGARTQERLTRMGARTIGDVARLGRDRLVRELGEAQGRRLYELSCGRDDRPVVSGRVRKSLGKEITFPEDVADRKAVERALLRLCVEVGRALRRRGLAGATVTVKLRFEGFETLTRQATLGRPRNGTEPIWRTARRLFRKADRRGRRIRLIGVSLSGLSRAGEGQIALFEEAGADRRVDEALDRVAERFGERAVTRAALLAGRRRAGDPERSRSAST